MGNLADYKRAWGDHRAKVKDIRAEYDKTLKGLEQYQGSAYGTEMEQAATTKYQADLQAARSKYGERVSKVLEAMKTALDERSERVTPPTDEQLRTLEAVRMMSSLSMKDYIRYQGVMDGSDVALKALHDIASERMPEGVQLPEHKTKTAAAWEIAKALSREAKTLNTWDASQGRGDALRAHLDQTKGQQVRGVPSDTSKAFEAACVGDIDPTSDRFYNEVVGMVLFDADALQLLD